MNTARTREGRALSVRTCRTVRVPQDPLGQLVSPESIPLAKQRGPARPLVDIPFGFSYLLKRNWNPLNYFQ